jgi:hypothetical protein
MTISAFRLIFEVIASLTADAGGVGERAFVHLDGEIDVSPQLAALLRRNSPGMFPSLLPARLYLLPRRWRPTHGSVQADFTIVFMWSGARVLVSHSWRMWA